MYDLIEKDLKHYYITAHKYISIASLIISMIFAIVSTYISTIAIIFLLIFIIISLIFCITYFTNKKKYGKKISLYNNNLCIYNHKNKAIHQVDLTIFQCTNLTIAFRYNKGFIYKNCLVIFNKIELYEKMEYFSYCDDQNIVIVQNPIAIREILKRLN